jgi:hypothetical protein
MAKLDGEIQQTICCLGEAMAAEVEAWQAVGDRIEDLDPAQLDPVDELVDELAGLVDQLKAK